MTGTGLADHKEKNQCRFPSAYQPSAKQRLVDRVSDPAKLEQLAADAGDVHMLDPTSMAALKSAKNITRSGPTGRQ